MPKKAPACVSRSAPRRLSIEALEYRYLLSASIVSLLTPDWAGYAKQKAVSSSEDSEYAASANSYGQHENVSSSEHPGSPAGAVSSTDSPPVSAAEYYNYLLASVAYRVPAPTANAAKLPLERDQVTARSSGAQPSSIAEAAGSLLASSSERQSSGLPNHQLAPAGSAPPSNADRDKANAASLALALAIQASETNGVHFHAPPSPSVGSGGNDLEPVASAQLATASISTPPQPGIVLAGMVPVDWSALQQSVDQFFQRIADLQDERGVLGVATRMAPWVITALVATGATEFARRQTLSDRRQAEHEDSWIRYRWAGGPGRIVPGFKEMS
jgi:hypothetical protein